LIDPGATGRNLSGSAPSNASLYAVIGALVILGLFTGSTGLQILGYLAVLAAAVAPGLIWLQMGAPGIPVLPVVAMAYVPYFAWPALNATEDGSGFPPDEVLRAALTVAAYLLIATVTWKLVSTWIPPRPPAGIKQTDWSRVIRLMVGGLCVGLVYHVGIVANMLDWTGGFYGVVRTVSVTFLIVACFLVGVTRAKGVLRGKELVLCIAMICTTLGLAWSSLFLVGGMLYILAVMLGYIIVSRRVPWLVLGTVFLLVSVLHAGKSEMRNQYWEHDTNWGGVTSVFQVPAFAAEWFATGLEVIAAGKNETGIIERASLLQMLLLVQSDTPGTVPYLDGETYALLPAILVPRFIDSDKPASQVGMDTLNIHYGLLTLEGVASTAIGWGLVAEAYANFGYPGVAGIAVLLGAVCGLLLVRSANAELLSVPTLVSIAFLLGLVNLEADFIALCSSLMQAVAAVLIFYEACRMFASPAALPAEPEGSGGR